jgi:phosphotransferase system enzyme I (PtsI)
VKQAKHLLNEAAGELDARGVPYRHDLPLGVMVETPAAALSVHTLVDDVSFLSIGTNDLVQYTLAVDRGSANLASRFTPLHPAVLTLIKRIVDVGVAHRLEVAVCGEMASQPLMAFALIGLGVRCLSVAGRAVPLVKRIVRGVSVSVAAEAANAALESRTAREAEGELRRRLLTAFGDAPFLRDGLPSLDEGNILEGSGGAKTSSAHE